jgi:hypothetical protein
VSASRVAVWVTAVTLGAAASAPAQPREVGAMVTEIRPGRGRVEVRGAEQPEWRPAGPLLALKVGDSLRATGDASAVVVLAGRRGSVEVDAARSPFLVPASPTESRLQKVFLLIEDGLGFLGSGTRETPRPVLSTRGPARPPRILSPRGGPVLADSLAVDWRAPEHVRSTLRVTAPSGIVLEAALTGPQLYPLGALNPVPGSPYRVEVYAGSTRLDEVRFEVADRARADQVRRDLQEVEQALGPETSAASRAVVLAGVLASRGFLHDARRVVLAAIAADPTQASLHALLGDLYARTGLAREADEAHEQARALASPRP